MKPKSNSLLLHKDDPRKIMDGKILVLFGNKNSQEVQHGVPENASENS